MNLGRENVDFFIDSDSAKRGLYLGKAVVHPSEIVDWADLFIYVPSNYYTEIAIFLQTKGLHPGKNFDSYDGFYRINARAARRELEQGIEQLQQVQSNCRTLLVYEGGGNRFLQYVNALRDNGIEFFVIAETFWYHEDELRALLRMPIKIAPSVLEFGTLVEKAALADNEKSYLSCHPELEAVVQQFCALQTELDYDNAALQAVCIHRYIEALIIHLQPERIITGSSVSPEGAIMVHLCKKYGVHIFFRHPGVIPGTLPLERDGEMGASYPAIFAEQFRSLSVADDELHTAAKVWEFLYRSKANRRVQPTIKCLPSIQNMIVTGCKTVFFAGVNDPSSHMVPYTEETRLFHSPIFRSSSEAAIYLAKLCARNSWNFIYKPHPSYTQPEQIGRFPKNTIFIEYGDINEIIDFADVTVTILSATSYNALIRYKPVVMLGYTQLRGKGCTYEAFEKDKIEDAIKAALENGFTQEQQDAFLLHMAQCLKYYLYDDLQERPIRYGRPVPKSMDEFYELERLLKM